MLQPPLDRQLVFLTSILLKGNIDVEHKQNLKSGKTKIRKEDLKRKEDPPPQKKKKQQKKCNLNFDVVFLKHKQRRNKTNLKQGTNRKQK